MSKNLYTPIDFEYAGIYKSGLNSSEFKDQSQVLSLEPKKLSLNWNYAVKIGPGFENLGNTCFFNSVLQCLTYTAPLVSYLIQNGHKKNCKISIEKVFCSMCALEDHLKTCFLGKKNTISPIFIIKNLKTIWKKFRLGSQEDSHEFLRLFLDHLHKSGIEEKNKNSIISQIFSSKLKSQVQCLECQYISEITETFMDLSLDVQKSDSLMKSLEIFFRKEHLTGNNKYRCSKCKKLVNAVKGFKMAESPNVLTIHFKRFNNSLMKINKYMNFPNELNLNKYVDHPTEDSIYNLYAVLVHQGHQMWSGHYYSYVKNSNNIWYLMNDESVRMSSIDRILKENAYILFYMKKDINKKLEMKENHEMNGKMEVNNKDTKGKIELNGKNEMNCKTEMNGSYGVQLKTIKQSEEYKNYIDNLFKKNNPKPQKTDEIIKNQQLESEKKTIGNSININNNLIENKEKKSIIKDPEVIKQKNNFHNDKLPFSNLDSIKNISNSSNNIKIDIEPENLINNIEIHYSDINLNNSKLLNSKISKLKKLNDWNGLIFKKIKQSEDISIKFCSGNPKLNKIKNLDEIFEQHIEEENDPLQKQRKILIENNKNFFISEKKIKDEYDLEYDRGKKKKIKIKKEKQINDFTNAFKNKDKFKSKNAHLFQKKSVKKFKHTEFD